MLKSKRGLSVLFMLFSILIVLVVVGITLRAAHAASRTTAVQQEILADDIRMMIHLLVAVPGDAVVKYPGNATAFELLVYQETAEQGSQAVVGNGAGAGGTAAGQMQEVSKLQVASAALSVKRELFLPAGYLALGTIKGKETFCLAKRGKQIFLRECRAGEP